MRGLLTLVLAASLSTSALAQNSTGATDSSMSTSGTNSTGSSVGGTGPGDSMGSGMNSRAVTPADATTTGIPNSKSGTNSRKTNTQSSKGQTDCTGMTGTAYTNCKNANKARR